MSENMSGSSTKRKALSATLAVAMAATMLLSGTLAYFYQSRATNTITNSSKNVVGHDDFYLVGTNNSGDIYNKDVYVENIGGTPVFVRVKLTEDLTLDGEAITTIYDKETGTGGVVHIPAEGTSLGVGTNDKDTTAAGDIHSYFTWDMGNDTGADKSRTKFLSARSPAYAPSASADAKLVGVTTEDNVAKDNSGTRYDGTETHSSIKNYLGDIAPAKVMTMAEYKALENDNARKNTAAWVIDTDGWCYWSQLLQPLSNTGLLLNGVTVDKAIADLAYTYNIHVDFESVDNTDLGLWVDGEEVTHPDEAANFGTPVAADSDAAKLLSFAVAAAPPESVQQQISTLAEKYSKATSEAVKHLYQAAIAYSDRAKKATTAQDIAAYTDQMHFCERAGDELVTSLKTNPTEMEKPVLVLKDGAIDTTAGATITAMDSNLAQWIMNTYDFDGNGILTKEEACAVENISNLSFSDSPLTSFQNTGLTVFPNLMILEINNALLDDGSFALSNYFDSSNAEKGLRKLTLERPHYSEDFGGTKETTFALTEDCKTLRDFSLNGSCAIKALTGLSYLTNIVSFYCGIDCTIQLADVNTLLSRPSLYQCILQNNTYIVDTAGKKIDDASLIGVDATTGKSIITSNLSLFVYRNGNSVGGKGLVKGKLNLYNCPKLNYLILRGTGYTVYLNPEAPLQSKCDIGSGITVSKTDPSPATPPSP